MQGTADYCPFCNELAEPALFSREQPDWPFGSRIVHMNTRAFVIPGVGPQVYPYFLILTRRHTLSLASATRDERIGILSALQWLVATGIYVSGTVTVFEHGGCGGKDGASCMDHAHLHVVDAQFDILPLFTRQVETAPAVLSVDVGLPKLPRYVFVGRSTGEAVITGQISDAVVPRQYCRRLLASLIGGEWNWRLRMHREWMQRAVVEINAQEQIHKKEG